MSRAWRRRVRGRGRCEDVVNCCNQAVAAKPSHGFHGRPGIHDAGSTVDAYRALVGGRSGAHAEHGLRGVSMPQNDDDGENKRASE